VAPPLSKPIRRPCDSIKFIIIYWC